MEALSRIVLMLLALLALARAASAQQPAPYPVPDGISFRKATIWSEGTRMAAEVFAPASEQKLPTIIMAHGWGALSTDGVRVVRMYVTDSSIETEGSGYGAYALEDAVDTFSHCTFKVNDYGLIIGGKGTG